MLEWRIFVAEHGNTFVETDHASNNEWQAHLSFRRINGGRLLRDLRERPQFADPAASLGYMLSEAEPAYRDQTSAASHKQTA